MIETWLPITGYEGLYSVSDQGRVRSEDRVIMCNGSLSRRPGVILKPHKNNKGYLRVRLCGKAFFVHYLVLSTFEGPRTEGLWVLHKDDDHSRNMWSNLYYGTPSQNMTDLIKNGNHHQVNKIRCRNGHRFTKKNTAIRSRNGSTTRRCRTCDRINQQKSYWKRKLESA